MIRARFRAAIGPARLTAAVALAMLASLALVVPAPAMATFSITTFWAHPLSAPAGSHPDSTVHMEFGGTATEDVQNIIQHFPSGIIPNPNALPKCETFAAGICPADSRLGSTTLTASADAEPGVAVSLTGDVYNIAVDPPYVGGLGFVVAGSPLAAPFTVRSARHNQNDLTTFLPDVEADITQPIVALTARDYGLTGISVDVPRELDIGGGTAVPIKINAIEYTLDGKPLGAFVDTPNYLTTTTACLSAKPKLEATSYDGQHASLDGDTLTGTGCDETHLPYDPQPFGMALGNTRTDTPSSYDISVNIPATENWGFDSDRHQPYLKRGSITLPPGTALSPPAAQGLEGCTDGELGFGTQQPPDCPAGSDIGDVTVESKNVDHVIHGDLYLGEPTPGHTYRLFIAFPIVSGLWIKLDGESFPDADTGQVTTVFEDLPMLPFEKFTISTDGGDRAVLVNPPDCGAHTITSTLTPWSAATDFPADRNEHPTGSFSTSYDGAGGGCPDPFPFDPIVAGSTTPFQAGAHSDLSLELTDPDRHQLVKTVKTSLPPGLVGVLPGISLCSVGDAAAGSCGEASRIGTVDTTVGSGGDPLPLPGSIYLAKPLQAGDPASLSIVVPAKAGPFDFGNVVIRARIVLRRDVGLDVVLVDDLPKIIEGIPIRLRTAGVSIDRSNFMRNPTSCARLAFGATFTSREGTQKTASAPYKATRCAALPFSPKLRFTVEGEIKKDGHPTLKAVVTQPAGQANIAASRVVLPDALKPEVLALQRPGGLCPEALLATRSCPASSQVGVAKATSPLLPDPLSGPVYVVQQTTNPLPKLAVFLDGLVSIELDAQNAFQGLRIVNQFNSLPDVPVSQFELTINGGKKGILKNSADLCKKAANAGVTFTAHSGKTFSDKPLLETPACPPRVSIALSRLKSGNPSLTLRVRRAANGTRLRGLSLRLPRSLHANPKRAREGVRVKSARILRRSQWKLTRRGVLRVSRLPREGVNSITAVLRKGALKAATGLRAKARAGKPPRLAFRLRITDARGRRLTVTRRVRPRS